MILYCAYEVSAVILKALSLEVELLNVQGASESEGESRRELRLILLRVELSWHFHIDESLVIVFVCFPASGSGRLDTFHSQRIYIAWLVIVA